MTTENKSAGADPQEPRKKGGADGKAKSTRTTTQPRQEQAEATRPADAGEAGVRSRKITTPRR